MEPVSPALAGGFLTPGAPGKPQIPILYSSVCLLIPVSYFTPSPDHLVHHQEAPGFDKRFCQ